MPRDVHHGLREAGPIALALAVCLTLTCGSAVGVGRAQSRSDDGPIRELEVAAGRFSFAPDAIEVVQGERVRLTIRSLDVEHGFGIAALGIEETIPAGGDPVVVEFVADQAGEFPIHCSVFCGRGHAAMSGTLIVRGAESEFASSTPAGARGQQGEDFTLIALPTTQALPRFKSAFRVSHRFSRPLGQGDVGSLVENLFGFDSSALIGLEFRFSPVEGGQIGFYRTSDRTIQLSGQYALLRAGQSPVSIDAIVAVDGTNNFRDEYSPTVGAIVSWMAGERVALYGQPLWVGNANIGTLIHATRAGLESTEDHTFLLGLGGRVQLRPTVFAVVEVAPRLAGFANGHPHASVAIEKRVGGHGFQVNFSNGIGATYGQIARGGSEDDWFIGFNITRRFF